MDVGTGGGGLKVNKFEQVSTLGHPGATSAGGVLYSEVSCQEKAVINSSTGTIPEEQKKSLYSTIHKAAGLTVLSFAWYYSTISPFHP